MTVDDHTSSPDAGNAPGAGETVTAEKVIEIGIQQFADHGFAETKLDNISRISGMSKRMIHYHFGDKRGLYVRCLGAAAERLTPPEEALHIDSNVPIEGMRRLVDVLYFLHVENPDCVRLMAMESATNVIDAGEVPAVADLSGMALHISKLLMLGQDAGAFRPGISANDLFTLISALASHRVTNKSMLANLLGVDMDTKDNTLGLHRMTVDTILAFLTANIPDIGFESYLTARPLPEEENAVTDIYG